jgi:hypothetical protein
VDIRQSLMAVHSKQQAAAIAEFIGDDPARFAELMKLFFAGEYRLTQRAAWPMSYCAELHPELIRPYLPKLLKCLRRGDQHDAVRRNVLRLLQYVEIPKRLMGRVYTHCVDFIDDPDQPIAVRAFAMTVAARIAETEPDLLNELRLVVSKHLPNSTPAFRVRARNILR